jgi:hypothetical protein
MKNIKRKLAGAILVAAAVGALGVAGAASASAATAAEYAMAASNLIVAGAY